MCKPKWMRRGEDRTLHVFEIGSNAFSGAVLLPDFLLRKRCEVSPVSLDVPWQIAVGSDLQHPAVRAARPAQVRFINWYLAKFYRAAQRDAVLATRFLEIANLMKAPAALLEPRMALRVWKGNRALA